MGVNDKKDLGYLGEDFQYKLIHTFMEEKEFFKDISPIVDQNMFTDPMLKIYVGVMKEYYEREEAVPSYTMMGIALNQKAHNDIERETFQAVLNKIAETPSDGVEYIRTLAEKFFKQQNIVRTANEILKIAGDGDTSKYERCLELLNDALNQGSREEFGSSVFDDIGETLSDDYRTPIPTGVGKLDEALEGGLGKGELGVIIGSSSFGKAQPLDSRIVTPDGWKLMGDMKVGDNVIGADGKSHKVIGVFPQGIRPIYKVSFSNGTSCECDIEHLWNVGKRYSKKIKTKTLREIIENGLLTIKNKRPKFYIPICKPIEFSENGDICFDNKREEFLQFNLNKNGKLSKGKSFIKHKTNDKALHDKLVFIARSLGMWVSSTYKKNGDIYLMKVLQRNNDCVFITKAEYVGEKEAQCIMVDSDEHLYLTEDFIVTHNTSLTTAMASHAATHKCEANNHKGFKVLQIVFEDRIKQIQRKHIGRITGIEAKDLSKREYIDTVMQQLELYEDKDMLMSNLKILRLPSGDITAAKIERLIKKLINNGFKPDLMIVDYFECLNHVGDNTSNEWEKEGKTMRKFESMAAFFDMAIWLPTQGTRDSVNLELVTMDKAGGSFKKIQIAHIVMSIARTMEDIEANKATIALLKNRAGKSGKVFNNVEFNNGTCRISTDNVDEFESMMEYNKNAQKEKTILAKEIFKLAQQKK